MPKLHRCSNQKAADVNPLYFSPFCGFESQSFCSLSLYIYIFADLMIHVSILVQTVVSTPQTYVTNILLYKLLLDPQVCFATWWHQKEPKHTNICYLTFCRSTKLLPWYQAFGVPWMSPKKCFHNFHSTPLTFYNYYSKKPSLKRKFDRHRVDRCKLQTN